jgi:hypothetical protein
MWHRLRSLARTRLVRRAQHDRDLDDEIRFHLAEDIKLRIDRGASAADAERDARRAFGSIALTKENSRGVWVPMALEQLLQDLRLGLRIFTKSPALAGTAALLVALVVGGFLYGVTPTDSRTYLAVFGLLATSSLLACYLPARRASRINPLQALRQD